MRFAVPGTAALFSVALMLRASAAAAACEETPRVAPASVVRVQSRSGSSLGVVVVSPDLVLVPFDVVSVERPWQPDAKILDARGVKHDATVVAADPAAGLALVRVAVRLSDEPLAVRADPSPPACARSMEANARTWSLVPYDGWPDPSAPFPTTGRFARFWRQGAPIVDEGGQLAGIVREGGPSEREGRITRIDAPEIERFLAARERVGTKRPHLVFHFGTGLLLESTPSAGVWGGIGFHAAARVRDITELRVDASVSYLWPVNVREGGCVEGCVGGMRGTVTPSVGARITLANAGEPYEVAITPSLGLALGAQAVDANSAPAYDAKSPSTYALAAPGVALSLGPVEARCRVRLPGGGFDRETWDLGVGIEL